MPLRLPDDEIAYHEAGHVAMCIILDVPMDFVTIDQAGVLEGMVYPGDDFRNLEERVLRYGNATLDEKALLLKYVRVIYAGPMSHGLYLKDPYWWTYLNDGNDIHHAREIIKALFHTEQIVKEIVAELRTETMLYIPMEETQEIIRKIATELLSGRRRLTLQECKDLL